jgi:hypothetical protein
LIETIAHSSFQRTRAAHLHEHGQGLADPARGAEDGDLARLGARGSSARERGRLLLLGSSDALEELERTEEPARHGCLFV